MTVAMVPGAEPIARRPVRARSRAGGLDERVLDVLYRRLERELADAIQDAANVRAGLDALHAATPALASVQRLYWVADRCRSASYHVAQATQAACEIDRLGVSRNG